MSETQNISAVHGNGPTRKAGSSVIYLCGSSGATPDTHEPSTPPSPPSGNHEHDDGETVFDTKGTESSETPPSNDAKLNTPQSPPTPDSWIDRISNDRNRDDANVICKVDEGTATPTCLLNERRIQPKHTSRGQMVELNMGTPSTACTLPSTASAASRQSYNFFRKYSASNASSKISLKMTMADQNICSSTLKNFRPAKKRKQSNQLFLDFGQKSFGKQTVCNVCGMLRVHGLDEDDSQHDKICKEYQEGVTCLGWKNERMVAAFGKDERILEVRPDDAHQHKNKVSEARVIVDLELGFATRQREDPPGGIVGNETCYLYISKKRIVGLLLVKRIQRAYELIPSKGNHEQNKGNSSSISRSLKPSKALLGVHQIWVHKSHRHRGIASRLVTAARDHLIFGMYVPLELVAFSSPTNEGLRFAKRYVGSDRPLIYDIH
ncbi:hypothetical protein ACHAXA_001436 [Cyclostephanos tholiformis]|uniref:N-acetyltransferase domain-containing protein n=1 Tax=Cyclostephanos tholiformis TaxID=382380 RepID=A0ABD3RJJ9_9STRA